MSYPKSKYLLKIHKLGNFIHNMEAADNFINYTKLNFYPDFIGKNYESDNTMAVLNQHKEESSLFQEIQLRTLADGNLSQIVTFYDLNSNEMFFAVGQMYSRIQLINSTVTKRLEDWYGLSSSGNQSSKISYN